MPDSLQSWGDPISPLKRAVLAPHRPVGVVLKAVAHLALLGQDVIVGEAVAREALADAVALWEVRSTFAVDEVVSAAVDALVAGLDSPALRELAGASAAADYWTMRPLVEATLAELSIEYPGPDSDEVQIAAARVMCKRLLSEAISPRDFVAWAHATVGHEGAARLQPFVDLDDVYDITEYIDVTVEELDDVVRDEAKRLLAGEPTSDARIAGWPITSTTAADAPEGRFQSLLRRATRLLAR